LKRAAHDPIIEIVSTSAKLAFEHRYRPPYVCLVAAADAERLADALKRGIRETHEMPTVTGRGAISRFPLPNGEVLVRLCRRGGAISNVLSDRYLFVNRPLKEFRVHCAAYELGVPVPEPLGVAWARSGIAFRGALATRYVPLAPLSEFSKRQPQDSRRAMENAGALVRRVHDAGLYHADLNAGNILADQEKAVLIDLDKATIHDHLSNRGRAANLRRLRRSLRKLDHPPSDFAAVCEGYGGSDSPAWLSKITRESAPDS
jgi:3-deoxy-D-manno-octulosonic acid kinase